MVRVLREPRVLYRGCFGTDEHSLLQALASNHEAARPPHPAARRAAVLHMAVSGFEDARRVRALARRRPDRLGTHVARLELRPGHGICLADTGGPGHWSIWGVPTRLLSLVTAVEEV